MYVDKHKLKNKIKEIEENIFDLKLILKGTDKNCDNCKHFFVNVYRKTLSKL